MKKDEFNQHILRSFKLTGTAKDLKANMPALEQISHAIAESANTVQHTTKATREREACARPAGLREA